MHVFFQWIIPFGHVYELGSWHSCSSHSLNLCLDFRFLFPLLYAGPCEAKPCGDSGGDMMREVNMFPFSSAVTSSACM